MELLERHRPNLRIPRRHSGRRESIRQYFHNASLGGFVGAVVGLLPMLVLMLILDHVLPPSPSSSAGEAVFSTVLAIGWGAFIITGAIVAVWRFFRKRV
jgi:predicted lysophospholipase L1 biosynthesis ABC-type transport system permease subunit